MTEHIKIGDIAPRIRYIADGEQTAFIFPFPIFKDEDLNVWVNSDLQEEGYAIYGAGVSDGGEVEFDYAPLADSIVTLVRKVAVARTSDFQTGGAFRAKVINDELDFQIASIQQVKDEVERAMRLPPYAPDINMELPLPNAGKALIWNEAENGIVNSLNDFNAIVTEATAQAGIAAAQAGEAITARNDILNNAGFQLVVGDLTGDNKIGAVAANEANIDVCADNIDDIINAVSLVDFLDFDSLDEQNPLTASDVFILQNTTKKKTTLQKIADFITGVWKTSLAPAGTIINVAETVVTSSVTTTSTVASEIISIAYTPIRSTSKLQIELSAYRIVGSYDYGDSEVDGSLNPYILIFNGATQVAGHSTKISARSRSDGTMEIQGQVNARSHLINSVNTNERTYIAKLYSGTNGHTATITADANKPIVLTVKEIA